MCYTLYLVDGFVAGTWRLNKGKDAATLLLQPLRDLSADDADAVAAEGFRLMEFLAPGRTGEVQFVDFTGEPSEPPRQALVNGLDPGC
jgi:hypothetical protein